MTASEQLRALRRETLQAGYIDDTFVTLKKCVDALPFIIDVVEAAESVTFFGQEEYWDMQSHYEKKLRRYEEALRTIDVGYALSAPEMRDRARAALEGES